MGNDYREWGYNGETGFYGAPQQICHQINKFRKTNEAAISANTMAIIDQTNRLESAITIQTIIQHEDSVAMKEQQAADAESGRTVFQNVFGVFIKSLKEIFTGKKGDKTESFYEMIQRENDETQAYISAHTAMEKEESDQTQDILTANTKAISDGADEISNAISIQKNALLAAINANTSGDTVNINKVLAALNVTNTKIDNVKSSTDGVKSTVDSINTKQSNIYNKVDDILKKM